jgi:protein-ribulosamine 3-kinase
LPGHRQPERGRIVTDWSAIAADIAAASGRAFAPRAPRHVGGGCINSAAVLGDGEQRWFVKLNDAARLDMFEAERDGLEAMAATNSIRVPQPLCCGVAAGQAFIAMEYVPLGGAGGATAALAGEQLAAMHRAGAAAFGWHRENTIGATPQPNGWEADWRGFWCERRLGFQLELAAQNGYGGRLQQRGARLLADVGALLGHAPVPSLLHGDLWGGNLGGDDAGNPVIFDPACYYGDREADIAMTELFGGFGGRFYAAYNAAWPLDAGYGVRKTLYNLYHILNHLNLFGGGYASQAERMMDRLLAELG